MWKAADLFVHLHQGSNPLLFASVKHKSVEVTRSVTPAPSVYETEISFLSTSSAANLHVGQTLPVALQSLHYLPFRGFPFEDVTFRVGINLLRKK